MRIGQRFRFTEIEGMDFPRLLSAIKKKNQWNQDRLAEELGVSQASVARYLKGSQTPNYESGVNIVELAISLGILTDNQRAPLNTTIVSIYGLVGLGENIEWIGEPGMSLEEIELPFPVKDGCVALEARGDSQFPRVKNGEIVIVKFDNISPMDMVGQEAVVKLTDGMYLMKTIRRGYEADKFNLESFNAPTRENVEIEQVGSIEAIIPAKRWRFK